MQPPPVPDLDFGLCARGGPRFSHPKPRDPKPAILFPPGQRFSLSNHVTSGPLSPQSFFPTGPQFSLSNHVTSGSGHVTSGPSAPAIPPGLRFPLL